MISENAVPEKTLGDIEVHRFVKRGKALLAFGMLCLLDSDLLTIAVNLHYCIYFRSV